jgi:ech hydrogenase subunit D
MPQDQTLEPISLDTLIQRVQELQREKYRLVQISVTRLADRLELTYSFDLNRRLLSLRLHVEPDALVPSISSIYWCAFLYENEIHDLFGLQVTGIAVDFHGKLYQTAIKFPFGTTKGPTREPGFVATPATDGQRDGLKSKTFEPAAMEPAPKL